MFYSSQVVWQADRDISNRIIERIYSLDPPIKSNKIDISFIGKYQHNENSLFIKTGDVFGASFYEWGNGNPYRINTFIKTLGENRFQIIIPDDKNGLLKYSEEMPIWPQKGSVALYNGVVIVKLSEKN